VMWCRFVDVLLNQCGLVLSIVSFVTIFCMLDVRISVSVIVSMSVGIQCLGGSSKHWDGVRLKTICLRPCAVRSCRLYFVFCW
jgi:hypothetical protein